MKYWEISQKPYEENIVFSIRVPQSIIAEYDFFSTDTGYSRNALIVDAMDKYIKEVRIEYEKYNKTIK